MHRFQIMGGGTLVRARPWLAVMIILMAAGCLEKYGRVDPSTAVDRLFEQARVLPDYHYFYAGGQNNPTALMGIRKDYTQTNRSWSAMPELTEAILKKRVAAMTNEIGHAPETYGGTIRNPEGEQVGIWYSKTRDVTIRFGENREISVSLPPRREEGKEQRSPFSFQ